MGVGISLIYWPTWGIFNHYGYSWLGMILGIFAVCVGWSIWWKIKFNSWNFLK